MLVTLMVVIALLLVGMLCWFAAYLLFKENKKPGARRVSINK